MQNTRKTVLLVTTLFFCVLSLHVSAQDNQTDPTPLTPEEVQWLQTHKEIITGIDTAWPPFEYLDDNTYSGIASSYIANIEASLDITFHTLKEYSWSEIMTKAKQKKVDLLPCLVPSEERQTYLLFTKPYISTPMVIITRKETPFIGDIAHVQGKIAVIEGYITEEILKRDFPNKKSLYVKNIEEGLQAVARGEAEIYPGNLLAVSYQMRQLALKDLHVSGVLQYNLDLCFGVRNDWPELVTILNKQIEATPRSIRATIESQWVNSPIERQFDYRKLFTVTLLTLSLLSLVVIYVIRRNRFLVRHAQKLAAAEEKAIQNSQAKSLFLSNMSHEIRTPMNAILGFSEILLSQEDDAKKKKFLQNILVSGKALLNLINNILDLSKIESGKQELKLEPTSLHELTKELHSLFEQQMKLKELHFITHVDSSVPQRLLLDSHQLKQVLINLIGNALKFTSNGSIRLSISATMTSPDQVELLCSVSDTGCGVSKEELELIFNPFEQASNQNRIKKEGTGLGLAISKSVIEMMGGTITIESEQEKGSTFTIRIPQIQKVDNGEKEPFEEITTPLNLPRLKVLIADDEKMNREILALFLKEFDAEISFATDGVEVLNSIEHNHPDVILLDIMMPDKDGLEVAKALKENPATKSITIIAVTALAFVHNETEIRKYCDDYIAKPVKREVLLQKLTQYFPYS